MRQCWERLEQAARLPILLVTTDYDGTLAPIVENPADARPSREAIVALEALAALPQTHVAVVSGRSLRDLAELSGEPEHVHLVGSHGSEFDPDFAASLPPEAAERLERLVRELEEIAATAPGFLVERKPASVAFHYRNADPSAADEALSRVLEGPGRQEDGVHVRSGKKVVELAVVETDKGRALETLRHRLGASVAVFLGDDVTDEDAFRTLAGPDVGIKVGEGESAAEFRVADTDEVAQLLARLSEERARWLAGSEAVPIDAHSLLSDRRTVALVTSEGRVTWLCAPRADSPALFAELLGGPTAGHFSVSSTEGSTPFQQRYAGETFVLETLWPDFTLTDYLDCSDGRPAQRAGRTDLVRVLSGRGRVKVEFAPRLDFGREATAIRVREDGLEVEGTLDPIVLRSPGVHWELVEEGKHHTAVAEIELEGAPVVLALRYGTGSLGPSMTAERERRRRTAAYWSAWTERLRLPSLAADSVLRSALVLRALSHGPTGGILAAATTSLPEHVGGVRNWDYRYCWLRDAAMSASSLVRLGSTSEAMRFLDWVLGVLDRCSSPERLSPLYTVTGAELGPEAELGELSGYRGSRPVRVGNAAARQVQLDVFGPIVELVHELLERGAPLSSEHWRLVEAMVHAVERRWEEPDHGIWEIRLPRRHHVHSKVMCWVTVDRAIRIASHLTGRDRSHWSQLRDRIAEDVLEHGFDEGLGAFTIAYGHAHLDAATLEIGLRGLLEPTDERFVSTVEALEQHLRVGPTVYRYRCEDGLPGSEGGFHLCTGWLVQALTLMGRTSDARRLLDDLLAVAGPTGLLSEEWGAQTRRALGNFPQAYSHLAVIDSALRLDETGEGAAG